MKIVKSFSGHLLSPKVVTTWLSELVNTQNTCSPCSYAHKGTEITLQIKVLNSDPVYGTYFWGEAPTVSYSSKIECSFNVPSGRLHASHKHSQGWACCRSLTKGLTFYVVKRMTRLKLLIQKKTCSPPRIRQVILI